MGVSAVLVTYNRLNLLKESIECLLKQKYKLDNIFIFNNNSDDGTTEYLDSIKDERIIVKNSSENLGGAGGFNECLKLAYNNSSSDLFWIMDDDTMPNKLALDALMKASDKLEKHYSFLCSNVRWWGNGEPCNFPNVSNDWTDKSQDGLIKVDSATFVSILVSRKSIKNLGYPIKDMFIWGDDTEYTKRLTRSDSAYFVSNSLVYHKTKNNRSYETIYNCDVDRIKLYKYLYRNVLYIDKKYSGMKSFIKDIVFFLCILFVLLIKSNGNTMKKIKLVLLSVIEGIVFNPKVEKPANDNKIDY